MNAKDFKKQFKLVKSMAVSIEKQIGTIIHWRKVNPEKNHNEASITVFTRWALVLKEQIDRYKFSIGVLSDMVIISGNDAWQSEQLIVVDQLKGCIPEMVECQTLVNLWVDTLSKPEVVH